MGSNKSRVGCWVAAAVVAAALVLAAFLLASWWYSRESADTAASVNDKPLPPEALPPESTSRPPQPSSDSGQAPPTKPVSSPPPPTPSPRPDSRPPAKAPPDPIDPIGVQHDGYFACKILFATDRAVETGPLPVFKNERGDGNLTYGSVDVSIPGIHEPGRIETLEWWRFWASENPASHVLVLSTDVFADRQVFADEVEKILADAGRDDVLLFIHGYNVEFEEAAKRTAQLTYDLSFPGAPMFFSWPSRGTVGGYPADEASIEWSVPHLEELLRFVVTGVGARRVHIIAHSMGNRALLRVLSDFDTEGLPPGSAEIRQIILAAPDIDAGVFEQLAARFPGKAERITLYTSRQDKAILASMAFHRFSRAGGSIVVVPGIDTVDASAVRTDFLSHSYFGDSIISDLAEVIRREKSPAERGLERRPTDKGVYWEYLLPK